MSGTKNTAKTAKQVPRPDSEAVANGLPHPQIDFTEFIVAGAPDAVGCLGRHERKEGGSGRFERVFGVLMCGRLQDEVGHLRGHHSK